MAHGAGATAVARLPFDSRARLAAYLSRVTAREAKPRPPGANRLRVAAGVGGFSPMIDAAIEATARRLILDLSTPGTEVTLRRFGVPGAEQPRTPDARRGGVWVWLGHGLRDRLPGVSRSELLRAARGADLAVLLACYAGDFAAPGECVAEQLLDHPQGPLAVVASTRVSMPYGNARFGAELLAARRREPRATVGQLVSEARTQSLKPAADEQLGGLDAIARLFGAAEQELPVERREHAAMYGLLGDPLLRLEHRAVTRTATQGAERR